MKLVCPECENTLTMSGYRILFPKCEKCNKTFHIDEVKRET